MDTGVFNNSPFSIAELIPFLIRWALPSQHVRVVRETTCPLFSHRRQWRSMVWSSHLFSTCLMQTPILPIRNKPYSQQCFKQSIWKLIKPEKYCIVLALAEWLFWPVCVYFIPFAYVITRNTVLECVTFHILLAEFIFMIFVLTA